MSWPGTLPEGLSYDGASRTISGTLSADTSYEAAESEGYVLRYQVMDEDGDAPVEPDPAVLAFTHSGTWDASLRPGRGRSQLCGWRFSGYTVADGGWWQ